MTPIDYSSGSSDDWVKLPKQGESFNYAEHGPIVKAEKVEGKKGFNFQKEIQVDLSDGRKGKAIEDLGYRYEFTFEDGKKLSLSQWKPFFAFKDADIQEGDVIVIHHPVKGEWNIEKLGKAKEELDKPKEEYGGNVASSQDTEVS